MANPVSRPVDCTGTVMTFDPTTGPGPSDMYLALTHLEIEIESRVFEVTSTLDAVAFTLNQFGGRRESAEAFQLVRLRGAGIGDVDIRQSSNVIPWTDLAFAFTVRWPPPPTFSTGPLVSASGAFKNVNLQGKESDLFRMQFEIACRTKLTWGFAA